MGKLPYFAMRMIVCVCVCGYMYVWCLCCVLWPIKNVSDLYWIVCVCVFVCVLNGPFDFYPLRPLKNLRPDLGARHVLIYSNIHLTTLGTLVIFDWLSVKTFKQLILI